MSADRTTEIIYGLAGQTTEVYPPEWSEGIPSSVTAAVYRGDWGYDDATEFEPSVTVDATSLQVSSASGYAQTNRRRVNVTSTSGISVGRCYLLSNAYGQKELIRPVGFSSNTYLDLDADLAYDYAASDTVKGLRMSFTVDATWVATESKILGNTRIAGGGGGAWGNATGVFDHDPSYRVLWKYTQNSIARRYYTYLRLVRQRSAHGVTIQDIERYLPEVATQEFAAKRGLQCRDAIDAAWGEVRSDIIAEGHEPATIHDTESLNLIVALKTVELYARTGIVPGGWDPAVYWERVAVPEYNSRFAKLIGSLRVEVDQGSEGAATQNPYRPWMWHT